MIRILIAILLLCSHVLCNAVNDTLISLPGELEIGTNFTDGNLIKWYEPESSLNSYVSFKGLKNLGKAKYFGQIRYDYKQINGTVWPIQEAKLYPYWIYDESKKNFVSNSIQLNGGYIRYINTKAELGAYAEYKVLDAYNQTDPRYNAAGSELSISIPFTIDNRNLQFKLEPFYNYMNHTQDVFYKVGEPVTIYQSMGLGFMTNPERNSSYDSRFAMQAFGSNIALNYDFEPFFIAFKYIIDNSKAKYTWSPNNWSDQIPIAEMSYIKNEAALITKFSGTTFSHTITLNVSSEASTGTEIISKEQLLESCKEPVWVFLG